MFMGTSNNSIDEKNRMIVPAKLRAELGARCILTKGLDQCLYIYTTEDWDKQMEKIARLPESDPKVRAFIRHFCANACECEFDKQGRIIIPQELKTYAGIEKDLVTMGAMTKIEIWSREVWNAPDNDSKMERADFAQALTEYNF
ncbi:MAG: division/cell wall cluster transcriptional repressor MraZ [Firmicutes bacterium]|nr:division/cell wall cluster transcriptional repressor MraZ [Bacillota bacterium]MBR3706214.1 division/cell wall cluster transcriptional repressor MraZ [Bacillota bacterium]